MCIRDSFINWQNLTVTTYSNVKYEFYEDSCDLTNKICKNTFTNLTIGKTYYLSLIHI